MHILICKSVYQVLKIQISRYNKFKLRVLYKVSFPNIHIKQNHVEAAPHISTIPT